MRSLGFAWFMLLVARRGNCMTSSYRFGLNFQQQCKVRLKLANWMSHSPRASDFPLFHGSRSHPKIHYFLVPWKIHSWLLCDSWRDLTKLQRGGYRNTHDCIPCYTCHVCKNLNNDTSSFPLTKDVYAKTRCLNMEHCAKLVGGNNDNKLR